MRRALLTGAAALLAGCIVFEVEPELRVELPDGDLTRAGSVDVRVHSAAPEALTLRLDGAVVARGLADGDLRRVDVSTLGDGSHRLTVESDGGMRTYRSGDTLLRIDRTPPRLVSSEPGAGVHVSAFEASASFDEPVAIDGAWLRLGAAEVPATASLSADGRRAVVAVPALSVPLVSARLAVHDAAGNPAVVTFGAWNPGALDARFDWAPVRAASWIIVQVVWRGATIPHVFLDEVELGVPEVEWGTPETELGGALGLDTHAFDDGPHRLSLRAAGYLGDERTLVVDNTPPSVVYCGPRDSTRWEARAGAEVVAVFDEEVFRADAPTYSYTEYTLDLGRRQPPPWIWQGTTPPVRDLAGNLLMETPCPVTFPIWRTPSWRSPAVRAIADGAADVRLVAVSETAVDVLLRSAGDPASLTSLRAFAPDALPSPSWRAAISTLGLAYELVGAGAGLAWSAPQWGGWELRNLTGAMWLVYPLYGPVTVVAAAEASVAWLQGAGSLRELHRLWPGAYAEHLDLSLDPSSSLEGLALDPRARRIALVERRPLGVALLHERTASVDFPAPPGPRELPLNADLAASASQPALLSTPDVELVAWVEAGLVRLRAGPPGGAYGEALVANADPAHPARSPVLTATAAGPILTFVEAHPGGDRLEARRLVDGVWRVLPSLELGTSGGRVDVAWPGVLWRGAVGDVQVRAYNE